MEFNDTIDELTYEFLSPMGFGRLDISIQIEVASNLEEIETTKVYAASVDTGENVFEIERASYLHIPALWSDVCDAEEQAIGHAENDAEAGWMAVYGSD